MPKLALPDGNAESAALDESDVASAWVVPDADGRLMIMLVAKDGRTRFVRHTEANIAYLSGINLAPSPVPSAIKVGLKR